mgnify:CR=1 FL=1
MGDARIRIRSDVRDALRGNQPVVALESTIIAHGMPYPRNAETALEIDALIRAEGAVPAVIAILDGDLCAGLDPDQIDRLARSDGVLKASRRDMAVCMARKQCAATTVSGTMIGAWRAGIRVFATGGIGGVHRGAADTFDISADLEELARTPVAVVSAGAKAILDLPLTLEVLETRGVPVIGIGTSEFPAFYSRSSGLRVPHRVDSDSEAARVMDAHWRLGMQGGILFANPIPPESEIPRERIDRIIGEAIGDAEREGICGAALTPFLLARIVELTGGESLEANIALAKHNAVRAARIARAYCGLARDAGGGEQETTRAIEGG